MGNHNPGQNILGYLRTLGAKTHFAKLTRIPVLRKAGECCYKNLFLLSPFPPSSVDCVDIDLLNVNTAPGGEGRESASY